MLNAINAILLLFLFFTIVVFGMFLREVRPILFFKRNYYWMIPHNASRAESLWGKIKAYARFFTKKYFYRNLLRQFRNHLDLTSDKVKREIEQFLSYKDYPSWSMERVDLSVFGIHRIKVKVRYRYIKVTFYTSRPGILMGRKGATIYGLLAYLKSNHLQDIRYDIIEYDPFRY